MATEPKRHLSLRRNAGRAACGVKDPARVTSLASQVTCKACARTLEMADAEARENPRITLSPVQSLNRKDRQ